MCFSSSPGLTVYVPPFCGVAVGTTTGVGGTGVAVGRGVAVGTASVGGGAEFDGTGRLGTKFDPTLDSSKLEGEARLVPGSCIKAMKATPRGTSSAIPSTSLSSPPPEALGVLVLSMPFYLYISKLRARRTRPAG